MLNTLCVLDQIDQHPAADRLLLNLLGAAAPESAAPAALPDDFTLLMEQIGYC